MWWLLRVELTSGRNSTTVHWPVVVEKFISCTVVTSPLPSSLRLTYLPWPSLPTMCLCPVWRPTGISHSGLYPSNALCQWTPGIIREWAENEPLSWQFTVIVFVWVWWFCPFYFVASGTRDLISILSYGVWWQVLALHTSFSQTKDTSYQTAQVILPV